MVGRDGLLLSGPVDIRPVLGDSFPAAHIQSQWFEHISACTAWLFDLPEQTVQARLGHASAAETLDTYSHLWPDSEDRTRDAVDLVLGNLADCVRTGGVPNT